MSVGAVLACATFVTIEPLCRRFEERSVLLWGGFLLMAIGRLLYIPYGDQYPVMASNATTENLSPIAWNISTDVMSSVNDSMNVAVNGSLGGNFTTKEVVGCPPSQTW